MSHSRIWLLDAYDRLPKSTQLVGLDISFDAAPPPEIFPASIAFQKWDVRDPVPDELIGAFDIVNVRFMVFVVLMEEVPLVVDKFVQMLSKCNHLLAHLMPPSLFPRLLTMSINHRARRLPAMGRA